MTMQKMIVVIRAQSHCMMKNLPGGKADYGDWESELVLYQELDCRYLGTDMSDWHQYQCLPSGSL